MIKKIQTKTDITKTNKGKKSIKTNKKKLIIIEDDDEEV
jgi:hypothetical protein